MTAKFPLANNTRPGSVYTYDPESQEEGNKKPYINEAVLTDKNFDAFYKARINFKHTPVEGEDDGQDVWATRLRINPKLGTIVDWGDMTKEEIPPHTHSSVDDGGELHYSPNKCVMTLTPEKPDQIYDLTIDIKGTEDVELGNSVYSHIFGMYINGMFIEDYEKQDDRKSIKLLFDVEQECKATIVYY